MTLKLASDVDERGGRIPDPQSLIFEHWHLATRIELVNEHVALVLPFQKVDWDKLVVDAQLLKHYTNFPGISRLSTAIKFHLFIT
jgi:hypothetical protein